MIRNEIIERETMKKLLLAVLILVPQMHGMEMETAKNKSSTNTCGNAVKACCYLTAACGLLTSGQPVNADPEDIACYKVFAKKERDQYVVEHIGLLSNFEPAEGGSWQQVLEGIKTRDEQRKACSSKMKSNFRLFCYKRDNYDEWLEGFHAWDRLAVSERTLGSSHSEVLKERERLEANYFLRTACLAMLNSKNTQDTDCQKQE